MFFFEPSPQQLQNPTLQNQTYRSRFSTTGLSNSTFLQSHQHQRRTDSDLNLTLIPLHPDPGMKLLEALLLDLFSARTPT